MKIYQVGGCVRDRLLGRQPHDIDYVVVGGTIQEMLDKGYLQVGKDFPVFLHPKTKDEYALARKEIKKGDKHTDFSFIFTPDISLEEDLQRRDFTINALALDMESNKIVDMVGGIDDLKHKTIRHINDEHFGEDPLRVLRMCRFAASLDFEIAPETMDIAKKMVEGGMLKHLTAERIWKEMEKALQTKHFSKFVATARECGALKAVLPEVDRLWDIPEKEQYHPEGNSGEHTMLTLKNAEKLSPKVKLALLLHDIGKIYTPAEILPAHHDHEKRGVEVIKSISKRLAIPNEYGKFAIMACKNHMKFKLLPQMRPGKILELMKDVSANFHDQQLLNDFIDVCRCDMLGRDRNISQAELDNFEQASKICLNTFEKAQQIRATDMPNFAELPKDKTFAKRYENYMIKKIFAR